MTKERSELRFKELKLKTAKRFQKQAE